MLRPLRSERSEGAVSIIRAQRKAERSGNHRAQRKAPSAAESAERSGKRRAQRKAPSAAESAERSGKRRAQRKAPSAAEKGGFGFRGSPPSTNQNNSTPQKLQKINLTDPFKNNVYSFARRRIVRANAGNFGQAGNYEREQECPQSKGLQGD